MLICLLVSLFSAISIASTPYVSVYGDTLDVSETAVNDTLAVSKISAIKEIDVVSLSPLRNISHTKIERLGTIGLSEVLNQFSGVSVKDYGGVGGLKTVSIRNMGASHTAVIYDGIPLSDAQNGQVDISRFNLDDVSSISLSIGVPDDIYQGARHLISTGILKIESKPQNLLDKSPQISSRMTFGSFGTYNPYISLKQALGKKYALGLAINGLFSKGNYPFSLKNGDIVSQERRLNSDVKSVGGEANFYALWDKCGSLKAKTNILFSERGLPGSVVLYTQNAYERLWDRSIISNIMYDCNLGLQFKLHTDFSYTYLYNHYQNIDPVYEKPQNNEYTQNEYAFAIRGAYKPIPHLKLVLAEDFFINTLDSNIPECPFPIRYTSVTALSAQYERERFRMLGSLVGTGIFEKMKTGSSISTPYILSPMIGLTWNFYRGLYLRASYKEGFRAPTFNDRYYARVGNRNLKPEKSRQSNLGLTLSENYIWGTLTMTADAYYNFIKDKIVAIPTMFIWKMRNLGKVVMSGLDITTSTNIKLVSWLSLFVDGNYSLQYALDVSDPEAKNYKHQIPYTPRHCGSSNLSFEMPWVNISYRLQGSGKRYVSEQNIPANEMDAYVDHSISANRTFKLGKNHSYKIFLGVELQNLSGKNYEIISYYPMPGRVFRMTMKFNY